LPQGEMIKAAGHDIFTNLIVMAMANIAKQQMKNVAVPTMLLVWPKTL
jgi:hypothetical protein